MAMILGSDGAAVVVRRFNSTFFKSELEILLFKIIPYSCHSKTLQQQLVVTVL